MGKLLIACTLAALVAAAAAWRDPLEPRSLELVGNEDSVAEGELVSLRCRSEGLPDYTSLTWNRAEGAAEFDTWTRGPSELTLNVTATAALNGMEYYCFAPFSEMGENGLWVSYFVYSPRATLNVQGAPALTFPASERFLEMTSNVTSTTHRVGDAVSFTCTTYGISTTVVTVAQAKGLYAEQLNTAWQPTRTLTLTLDEADHDTRVYCSVSTIDRDTFRTYTIVSNSVPIYVQ